MTSFRCGARCAIPARGGGLAILAMALGSPTPAPAQGSCTTAPLAVQVLGSGGPNAGGTRASTGYLVWSNGRAVALIDAGGGTFLRFGEAGARLRDLSLLAISHLHPDHASDLPALLWLSEMARQEPLRLAGPTSAGAIPGMGEFVSRLFDSGSGAFPFLGGTLGQAGRGVRLDLVTVDAGAGAPVPVMAEGDLEVTAIGVPHDIVPSVAYRVRVGPHSVVFGSDQNGSDPRFSAFAAGADLLVLHLALSEQAPDALARVHARPSVVGQVAQAARPGRLVLSHFMEAPALGAMREAFSLPGLDQAVAEVRRHFAGPVEVAADLQCFPIR